MPLIDWLEEDEDDLPAPGIYLVPIVKRQWGTVHIHAKNEERARQAFYNVTYDQLEAKTEWDDEPEYEIESCGVIERED